MFDGRSADAVLLFIILPTAALVYPWAFYLVLRTALKLLKRPRRVVIALCCPFAVLAVIDAIMECSPIGLRTVGT